jgi:WD40 repeat protein
VRNEAIACLAIPGLRKTREWTKTLRGGGTLDLLKEPYVWVQTDEHGNISLRTLEDDHEFLGFPGPGAAVYQLSFSPDRRFLGAGYFKGLVQVWDLDTKQVVFHPPTKTFRYLAFSPSGSRLAIAGMGEPITLYDLQTQSPLWSYSPKPPPPDALVFNPSGSRIAVPNQYTNLLVVLDAENGHVALPLVHPNNTRAAAWRPQGDLLATACCDNNVYLWDSASGRKRAVLAGHQGCVTMVAFNHSGYLLASGGWDGMIRLWDVATLKEIGSVPVAGRVLELGFSGDDRWLGCWGAGDGTLYETASGEELSSFAYGGEKANSLFVCSFSPDGRVLALGYEDGVRLWDVKDGRLLDFLPIWGGRAPIFSPSGKYLLTCSNAKVQRWPVTWQSGPSGDTLNRGTAENLGGGGSTSQRSLSRDGNLLAVIRDGQFHILDLETRKDLALPRVGADLKNGCLSPDGHWCAACAEGTNAVFVYDVHAAKLVHTIASEERIGELAFSPDGRLLTTCGVSEFRFWNVGAWTISFPVRRNDFGGMWGCVDFAPDRHMVAIATSPQLVGLFDTTNGEKLAVLESNEPLLVGWLAFSPDGTRLAASGGTQPAQVWDLGLIRKELAEMHLDWKSPPLYEGHE